MPIENPTDAELWALLASAASGLLGRYLGWVRGKDQSVPFSRWTLFYQLPMGLALGAGAGLLGLATGLGLWPTLLLAQAVGILGPDGVELILDRWKTPKGE